MASKYPSHVVPNPLLLLTGDITALGLDPFMVFPAIAVHLWMPLLVIAVILIRSTKYIFRAVSFMQWFLDKGDEHPLRRCPALC
jgi:hypothetical protein